MVTRRRAENVSVSSHLPLFSTESVPPQPSQTPKTPLPQTSCESPSQEWICANGELPAVNESAIVEMGPGPGIPASTAQGERLTISAVVYTRDCQPVSGVDINLWQTDPGVYQGEARPPPAHIHVEILHPDLQG